MFRFLKAANEWFSSRQQLASSGAETGTAVTRGKNARRNRSRKRPVVESVEERVLLSGVDLRSVAAATSAEVFQSKKSPVMLSGVSANGAKGGPAYLTATLTSGGSPLCGKTIVFQVKGRAVGRAKTNGEGVATLAIAKLKGMGVGRHGREVTARFKGDSSHKPRTARGTLFVSRFSTVLGGVSSSGVYNGTGSVTASLDSRGVPVAGQNIQFAVMGRAVGTATTNAQGVATLATASLAGLAAGSYAGAVSATFAGNLTYQQNTASGELTVSKASAGVTLGGLTSTYNGTAKSATVTTSPGGLAFTISYKNATGISVASPTGAGTYQVTATISDPNYTGSAAGSLVIAPAPLSVSGISASSKVYDGTTAAVLDTAGASLDGVIPGDSVGLVTSSASGAFASKNVGSAETVTVSGLSLTGSAAGNYTLTAPTTTANITAATLSVTGITANNKEYDGTNTATLNTAGATLVGVVPGDDVTLNPSGALATFSSSDVGTGKTVTIAGLALAGADAGNYALVQPTATADITVATLTVTGITASDKVYDGSTSAVLDTSGAVLVGVVPGDTVTLDSSGATGTFDSKNAGTGKTVTIAGLTLGGADADKYVLAATTTTANISAATLTVDGITAAGKVYNGTTTAALDTSAASLVGVVSGDDVTLDTTGAAGTFDTKNVGTGISVTVSDLALAGADAGNYTLTEPSTTADITAATLTLTGLTAANKTYDGTTAATLDTSGVVLEGVVPGDDVTLDVSGATATFDTKDVGTGITVTVSGLALAGADAGNYIASMPSSLTADITPAVLSVSGITASDKVYDGTTDATIDTSGATLAGVVPGEDVNLDASGAVGTFDTKDAGTGKTVTVSGLLLTGADIGNYTLGVVTTTADVTAVTLTVDGITAAGKVYDGTTTAALDTSAASLVGVVSGDDVTLDTTGAVGAFDTKNVGTGINVTVSGLALAGADAGNYTLTEPSTTADITAATLTVTGLTVASKAYDGTTAATLDTSGVVLEGVVPGDDVTLDVSGATATFDTKDVGTGISVTVSGLALAGADAGNYIASMPSTLTADITPAVLSVSGITASDKVYDGTTDATIDTSGATLAGVVPGEDVNLDASGAVGTFDTKDAGTGKTVTVSGLLLTGADIGNYTLGVVTTTADVTAVTLTVDGITAAGKVYDGTTTAALDTSAASLVGVVSGDDVTLDTTGAVGAFDTKNVGTGINVTVSGLALAGADAGNYTLTEPSTTADIMAATLTVTGLTAANKTYDGTTAATLDTSGVVLEGVVPGDDVTLDVSGATATFDTKDVGTGISVTVSGLALAGADAGNYIASMPSSLTADITPAVLSVSGITASDKVYDGTTDATIDTSGATLAGVVPGEDVNLDASGAVGTFDTKDAGTGKTVTVSGLLLTGADIGNYTLGVVTTTADVTALTITVDGVAGVNKVYDGTTTGTVDASGGTLVGVLPGDDVSLNATAAVGTFDTKDVGSGVGVTVSGLALAGADAGDYILTQPTTSADITAATLTVDGITAADKTYDGTTDAALDTSAATLAGVIAGDDVRLDTSGALGALDTKDVGTGINVTVSGLALAGADAGNYILTQPTTTADITAATLTVTGITAADKTYDGTTDAALDTSAAVLAGVIAGDDVSLDTSGALGAFDTKDVGTGINVTVSGLALAGADAGNYILTQPTTTADITAATLTVTGITAADKTYEGTTDATLDTSAAVLAGVIAGDDVNLDTTGALGTFDTKDVGTGINVTVSGLALAGADAGNYILTQPTTSADITAATLTLTGVTAASKTYDGTTDAALDTSGAVLAGVIAGDDVSLDTGGALGTFDTKNVGTAINVTASGLALTGADAGNYVLIQPTTTADITAATLTVTGITALDKAFDDTTDATLDTSGATLVGVVPGDDVTLDTSGAIGTFASVGPGTDITVTITGLVLDGADSGNYILTQPTTTASIT